MISKLIMYELYVNIFKFKANNPYWTGKFHKKLSLLKTSYYAKKMIKYKDAVYDA